MSNGRWNWGVIGASISAFAAMAGCAGADEPSSFVGTADGDVAVGLVVEGDAVEMYFCGPADVVDHRTAWLSGTLDAGEDDDGFSELSLSGGGWTVEGVVSEGAARGTAKMVDAGELVTLTWSVSRAEPHGMLGLYAAPGAGCQTGVVVFPGADGAPKLQGAYCDATGHFGQVTPVHPSFVVLDDRLWVMGDDAASPIQVTRVRLDD
jgi:hypothetical protein